MKSPMFYQNTESETDDDDFESKKNNMKRKKQIQLKRKFGDQLKLFIKN